ncbi:hypothetical protein AB0A81_26505 [Streptomyces flaveolus]|uniref:Resolvase/invertase-type recombinase catalytic domain-containing protein n=1 Tax=Streptomyces flaveolus TaxID=67297 RepID=A0ABV1VBF4_9ACTN
MATTQQDTDEEPGPVRAVLYVGCERSLPRPELATERAEEEGRTFAAERGITSCETVTDPRGQPDPARRAGWQQVREPARPGEIGMVIVRWPPSIAPEMPHDLPHQETSKLKEHGVDVRHSWGPVAAGRPR